MFLRETHVMRSVICPRCEIYGVATQEKSPEPVWLRAFWASRGVLEAGVWWAGVT